MKYGYARISSYSQKLDRQIKALTDVGCDMVITDKESGKNFDRKGYKRLMRRLNKGDELYIKSIDRLGRNYEEIIEQWRMITVIKEVDVIVLDFPCSTRRNKLTA